MICIAIAFLTAGMFLKDAFHGWDETPVMTTLDSIAAPIRMIQFPTVTICQDEKKPPDNWAFLETVLNNVAFECSEKYEDCNDRSRTSKIRKDFHDLIESVMNIFKRWLMIPEYEKTAIYSALNNNSGEANSRNILIDMECQIASLMENGKISKGNVFWLMRNNQQFAVKQSIESVLKSLSDEIQDYEYFDIFSDFSYETNTACICNTTKCEENSKFVDKVIRFLFAIMNIEEKVPFGSFLASFAHINDEFLCKDCFFEKINFGSYFGNTETFSGKCVILNI